MDDVFIGSEALRAGRLTRGRLRWHYAPIFPDVYVRSDVEPTLRQRIRGAWLWSGRRGIITGRAAAALHGALWVGPRTPIELIWSSGRPPIGVIARNEKIADDEIVRIGGMAVTTPVRAAFDLARHLPRDGAVRHLDALARATGLTAHDALSLGDRYPLARSLRRSGIALDLMDGGAQSPKETWLRLLVIDEGFPRPAAQIRISDGLYTAFVDMGWEALKIALDYDGERHQTDRGRFVGDISRNELIARQAWIDLHVVSEHTRAFIVHRLNGAFIRRGVFLDCSQGR